MIDIDKLFSRELTDEEIKALREAVSRSEHFKNARSGAIHRLEIASPINGLKEAIPDDIVYVEYEVGNLTTRRMMTRKLAERLGLLGDESLAESFVRSIRAMRFTEEEANRLHEAIKSRTRLLGDQAQARTSACDGLMVAKTPQIPKCPLGGIENGDWIIDARNGEIGMVVGYDPETIYYACPQSEPGYNKSGHVPRVLAKRATKQQVREACGRVEPIFAPENFCGNE